MKSLNTFIDEGSSKKCPDGQYYCFTDKKCKKIPRGYFVGRRGYLEQEKDSDETKKNGKNGNGNGNGNGGSTNGNGGSNGGSNGGGNGGGGMSEELNKDDKPFVKKLVGKLRKGSKTHAKQADDLEKAMNEESNPRIPRKKGQPANSKKHSDLYTDENPKGTIHGLGFKDVATAKASVSKIRNSSRSHAHKIQAAVAMEQRAREMGKTSEAAVYRKYINSMKKKTKKMNEEKHGDHEPEMIRSQLKTAGRASKRIEKHSRKKDNFKAWVQSKITKASDYLDTAADYLDSKDMKKEAANPVQQAAIAINMKKKGKKPKDMSEGSLRQWFKGSKSKDGKGGWVNVVTGGTCASDEPGEGTPKCVSSAKRASMTKAERLSAARRKKKADPGQQQKTGAAKPTYVSTDKPKKKMKEEIELTEVKDKKGKGSGTKDACYHKVKSRYSVWPSAYASGALVKCRKVGAANWGNKSEEVEVVNEVSKKTLGSYVKKAATEIGVSAMKGDYKKMQKRHKGVLDASDKLQKEGAYMGPDKKDLKQIKKMDNPDYAKKLADYEKNMDPKKRQALKDKATKGMKFTQEGMSYGLYKGSGKAGGAMKDYLDRKAKMLKKKRDKQSDAAKNNPHFDSTQPSPSGRNKYEQMSFQQFQEKCWPGYEKKGMKTMFGKRYPNCVKKKK